MGVIAEVECALWDLRCRDGGEADTAPELRASTMTHVVWAPPEWLPTARKTFAGLHERHPARTIFLVPSPGPGDCEASAALEDGPAVDDAFVPVCRVHRAILGEGDDLHVTPPSR